MHFLVDTMHSIPYNIVKLKFRRKNIMAIDKSKIKKVVLAYSGGLDTSIIIPWLKENYNN